MAGTSVTIFASKCVSEHLGQLSQRSPTLVGMWKLVGVGGISLASLMLLESFKEGKEETLSPFLTPSPHLLSSKQVNNGLMNGHSDDTKGWLGGGGRGLGWEYSRAKHMWELNGGGGGPPPAERAETKKGLCYYSFVFFREGEMGWVGGGGMR